MMEHQGMEEVVSHTLEIKFLKCSLENYCKDSDEGKTVDKVGKACT